MNIATVLKAEVNRLSSKAIRAQTKATRGQVTSHRHAIADLKRQVAELRKEVAALRRGTRRVNATSAEPTGKQRFSAKGFKSWRVKSQLSAQGIAGLLGVTAQTIYNWEAKSSVPRPQQIAKLSAIRKLGLRTLRAQLEASKVGGPAKATKASEK